MCWAVDHFGKNPEAGTRGASSKEAAADLVLAALGKKGLSGSNREHTISYPLAIGKVRSTLST